MLRYLKLLLPLLDPSSGISAWAQILLPGNAGSDVALFQLLCDVLSSFCQREEWKPKEGSYPPSPNG